MQCLKLSPNLRKQTKEVKDALQNKEKKKALNLEAKKLIRILVMVSELEYTVKAEVVEEDDPLK